LQTLSIQHVLLFFSESFIFSATVLFILLFICFFKTTISYFANFKAFDAFFLFIFEAITTIFVLLSIFMDRSHDYGTKVAQLTLYIVQSTIKLSFWLYSMNCEYY
jgi:hypothetical protein